MSSRYSAKMNDRHESNESVESHISMRSRRVGLPRTQLVNLANIVTLFCFPLYYVYELSRLNCFATEQRILSRKYFPMYSAQARKNSLSSRHEKTKKNIFTCTLLSSAELPGYADCFNATKRKLGLR